MRFFKTLLASALGTLVALGALFVLALLFVFALAAASDPAPSVRDGSVLVLDLDGALDERTADDPLAALVGGARPLDLVRIRAALRMAATDDRVRAVWLRVGGVQAPWAALEEVRSALDAYNTSGKPLYASGRGAAHSEADLFLTSAADSVFLAPLSIVEFNGFIVEAEFYKRGLDRLGVVPQVVRAGTFKSAVEPFLREDLSPENRAQLASLLETQNRVYLDRVAKGRRTTPARLQALADSGAVIGSEDALRVGLIDALLDENEVEALIKRRLALNADDDLKTITARAYARTPPGDAGIETTRSEGEVAVVYAVGAIVDGESGTSANPLLGGTVVGDRTFVEAMREARESDRVKAVVLRINSPGGSVSASESMRREIARTQAVKPVIVSMGDYAASGGYWIATAAERIVADPLTLTGSIGVFSLGFEASGAFEDRLGITFDRVQTSPFADMGALTSGGLDDGERALLQRHVDTTYAAFVTLVARARKMPRARADSLGQGRVWTGQQALALGLVDELGGLREATQIAARRGGLAEGAYTLRALPREKTFAERLTAGLEARAAVLAGWGASPAEVRVAEAARTLRRLAALDGRVQAWLPTRLTIR